MVNSLLLHIRDLKLLNEASWKLDLFYGFVAPLLDYQIALFIVFHVLPIQFYNLKTSLILNGLNMRLYRKMFAIVLSCVIRRQYCTKYDSAVPNTSLNAFLKKSFSYERSL